MNNGLANPILLIIFNRPDTTEKVFNAIKKIKPKKLFVSADGPRENKPGEKEKCQDARKIIDRVDWRCEVYKKYSAVNLGCKIAVSSGLNWFFKNVEQGIILEDDCLPAQSFFKFCEELLEKYKNNEKIMMISGDNFQDGRSRGEGSYYFSALSHIWGWAGWADRWQFYDVELNNLPDDEFLKKYFKGQALEYWQKIFKRIKNKEIDTWDYQWAFTIWRSNGLTILPNINLVSNIGFGAEATHTKSDSKLANRQAHELGAIVHPLSLLRNIEADDYTFKHFIKPPSRNIFSLIKRKFK